MTSKTASLRRARVGALATLLLAGCGVLSEGEPSGAPSASPSPSPSETIALPVLDASEIDLPELPVIPFDVDKYSLDDPTSMWVVSNKQRPLEPISFVPGDLKSVSPVPQRSASEMRAEAADALIAMYGAAKEAGVPFSVSSSYRSYDRQAGIYGSYVAERGVAKADTSSARPGYSEHQTGLAADLYDTETCRLKQCFADTGAGKWLAAHAHEYGFTMRYPNGKQDVVGYIWEPWHFRYVGVPLATELQKTEAATLEEFFGLPAAPTYD